MAESETKFSKVIEQIMAAARKRGKKATPEQMQETVNRIFPEKLVKDANDRKARIVENAKEIFTEAKAKGQHVTTSLLEWTRANKFVDLDPDPVQALKIARQDLSVALKAAKLPPDNWIAREAAKVRCAEAAQALTVVALAPEDLRENPYFLFQTAAQLAGSNSNPEAQPTIKAFVSEMSVARGKEGFNPQINELRQMLTESGMGAVPTPPPDFDPALFVSLPRNAKGIFEALNTQLAAARSDTERYEILSSFTKQIEDIDTSAFNRNQRDALSRLSILKARKEADTAPHYTRGLDTGWFERETGITPVDSSPFLSRGLTEAQIIEIARPPDEEGDAGIDKFVHRMMRRIFSSSREPRSPDLQEQTEYWEIEQLWRHMFGEEGAQAKLVELRSFWESEYRRNAINWHIVRGGSSNKDLIQKYFEGIPPDTMQHEQSILWAPEAISATESALKEFAVEKRFIFDEGRRWFDEPSTSVAGKTRLEAFGEKLLTGAEEAEAIKWQRKISHGSYIVDKDAQLNEPAFNDLTNLHAKIDREFEAVKRHTIVRGGNRVNVFEEDFLVAEAHNPGLTREQFFYDQFSAKAGNRATLAALEREWGEYTLYENVNHLTGNRLWNKDLLNKLQGFSPVQIRAMFKLEAMMKSKGILRLEEKNWKLSRAIFAASRSEVGSLRTVTLSHQMANMPAIFIAPEAGLGVMNAPWQEQMGRVQNPELFLRRFSIGGETMGSEIWAHLITKELENIDIKMKPRETFAIPQSEEESFAMLKARTLLLKSRRYFGIGYTEMPRGPLGTSISLFEGTSWRFEPTLAKLEEVYGRDAAERVGMGMRRAVNGRPEKEAIRKRAWEYTAKRTPSDLIKNLMTEETDQLLKDKHLSPDTNPLEWQQFNNVISVVENNIQTIEQNVLTEIDLGLRGVAGHDFDTFFTDDVFRACGVNNPAEMARLRNDYYEVIHGFQDTFLHNGPERGVTYIDLWTKHNFSITASISDYDISLTQWDKLPADHHFRRVVSDASGHLGVLEHMIGFHAKPELALQPDSKKVIEALGMLKGAANSYTDTKKAEEIMLTMDSAVVSYMESKNFYRWARVIPGGSTIFRQLAGIDTEKWWAKPIVNSVKPVLRFIANSPLFVRNAEERRVFNEILSADFKEWPRKFAQLHLGPTIAAAGPQATTWDPLDIDQHFDELEHSGLVISNHKLLNKMKDQHKSRVPWKMLALGQRYWWVPIVGTIAVGVIIALQEQGFEGKDH